MTDTTVDAVDEDESDVVIDSDIEVVGNQSKLIRNTVYEQPRIAS